MEEGVASNALDAEFIMIWGESKEELSQGMIESFKKGFVPIDKPECQVSCDENGNRKIIWSQFMRRRF